MIFKEASKGLFQCPPIAAASLIFLIVLFTKVEVLHNLTVSLDVLALEVVKELATLTYEAEECTLCVVVLLVCLEVFCQVSDTVGKQSNLALWRTGVNIRLSVFAENLLFFVCCQIF